ncbi:MAG: AAA family ATPase [Spirochaetes bacterium]|nr:AAA family ATPase [Spirochaetota bacterium]
MEKYQGYDMSIHEQFLKKLEKMQSEGISQAEISRQIGVSSSAISMYKSGAYDGAMGGFEEKIKSWLSLQDRKNQKLVIPYCEIGATNVIYQSIDTCQRDKDFAVIIGKAGTSKTLTAKNYVRDNKMSIYIKMNKSTVGALLRAIGRELKIDLSGSSVTLYEKIIGFLKGKEWVIVVDEADYLNDKCFQMLRHISDDAEIGVALIGLERLEGILISQKDDYQQLLRRIGTFLNLSDGKWKYNLQDAGRIIKSVWHGLKEDIVKDFFEKSKGSIGTLTKLMDKAYEIALKNGKTIPELIDIEDAKKVVMRACNRIVF